MKIGIIGIGVVGTAVLEGLKLVSSSYNIIGYDKYKKIGTFKNILNSDILFICVPTNFSEEKLQYNKQELNNVLHDLSKTKYSGVLLIKSTVEPNVSQQLADRYQLKIIHNPEFLSATTHITDFINQSHIVIGKTTTITDEDLQKVVNMYKTLFPNSEQSICTSNESECMKLFVNNFYSVKIQFCNELYQLCQKIGVNYDNVKNMMLRNKWIHPMHTQVPGTDGKLSYGGMCFPKDTNALLSFMKKQQSECQILESCVNERNQMRNDHINIEFEKKDDK